MNRSVRILILGGSLLLVLVVGLALAASSFAAPDPSLANSQWTLTGLNGRTPLDAAPISLQFEAGDRLSGNSGCNQYGATYQAEGKALTIGEIFSTKMACVDEGLNSQEVEYQQALAAAAQFELDGDTLTVLDGQGAAVLVFARATDAK